MRDNANVSTKLKAEPNAFTWSYKIEYETKPFKHHVYWGETYSRFISGLLWRWPKTKGKRHHPIHHGLWVPRIWTLYTLRTFKRYAHLYNQRQRVPLFRRLRPGHPDAEHETPVRFPVSLGLKPEDLSHSLQATTQTHSNTSLKAKWKGWP